METANSTFSVVFSHFGVESGENGRDAPVVPQVTVVRDVAGVTKVLVSRVVLRRWLLPTTTVFTRVLVVPNWCDLRPVAKCKCGWLLPELKFGLRGNEMRTEALIRTRVFVLTVAIRGLAMSILTATISAQTQPPAPIVTKQEMLGLVSTPIDSATDSKPDALVISAKLDIEDVKLDVENTKLDAPTVSSEVGAEDVAWGDDLTTPFTLSENSPLSSHKAPGRLADRPLVEIPLSEATLWDVIDDESDDDSEKNEVTVFEEDAEESVGKESPEVDGELEVNTASELIPVTDNLSCDRYDGSYYCNRFRIFVEGLYLRPGNADVTYAVERAGNELVLGSPTGQVGRVAPNFELGSRIGLEAVACHGGIVRASYSRLDSHTEDQIMAVGTGNVLQSPVTHPSGGNAFDVDSLFASASYDVDFDLVDVDYRYPFLQTGCGGIDFVAGTRYAHLEQEFASEQIITLPFGESSVETDIDFDGLGVRLGFEGRWSSGKNLHFYGRGIANFVGGEFKADYTMTSQIGSEETIRSSVEDYRVMAILDAEAGVGFTCRGGKLRLLAGYQVSGWFDAITTSEFIAGVHQHSFDNMGDELTFSGLVLRAELRY